jgi:hypothetical protein
MFAAEFKHGSFGHSGIPLGRMQVDQLFMRNPAWRCSQIAAWQFGNCRENARKRSVANADCSFSIEARYRKSVTRFCHAARKTLREATRPANMSTVLKLVLMDRLFVVRSPITRLARGHQEK